MTRLYLAAGLLLALVANPLPADDPGASRIELELAGLADDVAKSLAKQDQTQIRIGKFTGDGDIPSHFGPEIQRVLIAEFAKRKIAVNKDALIEIKGEYAPATVDPAQPTAGLMFVRINAKLVDTKTRLELVAFPISSRALYGNEELAKIIAPTTPLPPAGDRQARNEVLKKWVEKPETHVEKPAGQPTTSKIQSSTTSPFAVEILVVPTAKAADPAAGRSVTVKDGLAFVDIQKTEVYRVKVNNTAAFDIAVRLSIDGLDQYVFSDPEFRDKDGRPRFHYSIIPKGEARIIRGWFRNLKQLDSFVVTDYAKGAVAELNASQGEVGQICVQIHAAWTQDADKPKDETSKDAATGRGEKVDVDLKVWKGTVGVSRDLISVRYTK